MSNNTKSWPEFPKVVVEGKKIFIHYEDGTRQFWGTEDDVDEQVKVAKEIQEGLKAISYITDGVLDTLDGCLDVMKQEGFSKELSDEYLYEALRNVIHKHKKQEIRPPTTWTDTAKPFYVQ